MVLKAGKFGVNSGNTLRLSNGRHYLRRYSKAPFVIRHTTRCNGDSTKQYDTGLAKFYLDEDDVVFSLNKKARWSLPELIQTEVIYGKYKDADSEVKLIERHNIAKRANCFSICSLSAQNSNRRNQLAKRRGYLQPGSVESQQRQYSRRDRHDKRRWRLKDDIDEVEAEPTHVRYDVVYPIPRTCALIHNPNYIKPNTKTKKRDQSEAHRRTNKNKIATLKRHIREACSSLDGCIEDCEEEADLYQNEAHLDHNTPEKYISSEAHLVPSTPDNGVFRSTGYEVAFVTKPRNITMQDVFEKAKSNRHFGKSEKVKRTMRNETQQDRSMSTKGRIVYMKKAENPIPLVTQENTHASSHVSKPTTSGNPMQSEPMRVILPLEETTPLALRQRFGNCYIECNTVPRKFILDISDRMCTVDTHEFKSYKKNVSKVNACLVLTENYDNEMNNTTHGVYTFILKMNYSPRRGHIQIETVFDYMGNNLEELIGRILFFIDLLSSESILTHSVKTSYHEDNAKYNHLGEIARTADSYTVNYDFLFKYLFSSTCSMKRKQDPCFTNVSHFHVNEAMVGPDKLQTVSYHGITTHTDAISKDGKASGADSALESLSTFEIRVPGFSTNRPSGTADQGDILQDSQLRAVHPDAISKNEKVFDARKHVNSQDGTVCGSCHAVLKGENTGTALTVCGHWFCDRCWRVHLETEIQRGGTPIHCPKDNCAELVDVGTVVAFASIQALLTYAKHCHDVDVERSPTLRWCPNEQCGRVLKVGSPAVKIITCACGEQYCMDCLEKPHWPADCNSAKLFKKGIKGYGDSAIIPVEVAIDDNIDRRKCHHCERFVENKSKCCDNICLCVCGKTFFWGCGWEFAYAHITKTEAIHSECHRKCAAKCIKRKQDCGQKCELDELKRRKWYKTALLHRIGHHPIKYKNMNAAVKPLTHRLKELIRESETKGHPITLDYRSVDHVNARECDKVKDFLRSTIELYRQAGEIVENIAVLLDSRRSDKDVINSALQSTVNRLAYFVSEIYNLFVDADKQHEMDTLIRMKYTRQHTLYAIRVLVEYFKSEDVNIHD